MSFRTITWQSLSLFIVLACASPDSSLAAERLTIGQLHKYHASYHLHSVTIVGKVEGMNASPPLQVNIGRTKPRCTILCGVATVVLVDGSGSLQVENPGSCFQATQNLPQNGDQIELTVQIDVYVPEGQTTQVIKATTQEILVLK